MISCYDIMRWYHDMISWSDIMIWYYDMISCYHITSQVEPKMAVCAPVWPILGATCCQLGPNFGSLRPSCAHLGPKVTRNFNQSEPKTSKSTWGSPKDPSKPQSSSIFGSSRPSLFKAKGPAAEALAFKYIYIYIYIFISLKDISFIFIFYVCIYI